MDAQEEVSMKRVAKTSLAAALLAAAVAAQDFPVYKSYEDYCYHNPNAPT
jgi:hypothetical protein